MPEKSKSWSIQQKRDFEICQMNWMIDHTANKVLDPAQKAWLKKAVARHFSHCPNMNSKTFCSRCPAHCFSAGESAAIKAVMKSAGWKLLLAHPVNAFYHMQIDRNRL